MHYLVFQDYYAAFCVCVINGNLPLRIVIINPCAEIIIRYNLIIFIVNEF